MLLLLDKPIAAVARAIQRIHNALLRRRPPMVDLAERLTRERDTVRGTLGAQWGQAILRSAGNVVFDYWRCWRRSSRPALVRARRWCCSPMSHPSCWA